MKNFENSYKSSDFKKNNKKKSKYSLFLGLFLQGVSIFFFLSIFGYIFSHETDQSAFESFRVREIFNLSGAFKNWFGVVGTGIGYYFVYRWFGFISFILFLPIFLLGKGICHRERFRVLRFIKLTSLTILTCILFSSISGYLFIKVKSFQDISFSALIGGVGVVVAKFFDDIFGIGSLIVFMMVSIFIFLYATSVEAIFKILDSITTIFSFSFFKNIFAKIFSFKKSFFVKPNKRECRDFFPSQEILGKDQKEIILDKGKKEINNPYFFEDEFNKKEEKNVSPAVSYFDDTSFEKEKKGINTYSFPSGELLKDRYNDKQLVSISEINYNKEKIVETLKNFNIGISSIAATVGPTITLYEIIPNAGVKLSRIKNLEDDIALSLSALGIRIIAPIPGKGTVGIEVPNKTTQIVSLKPIIFSERFTNTKMSLPMIIGKGVDNEVYIQDLASMPHLLIAGATGQGKSVGLNVILTSLIFKKNPNELKFILIDPKKVELSIYETLKKHFLVNIPSLEDSIITETKKVVFVLKNLCNEMDYRYDLLKDAGVRNIKEYNEKIFQGKLNINKGHKFLPYIVLVIDEFADLMMVAGKEVELPIARLAQLARAIGIHLIIATQRPSVNVITGIIKANFPARISFKVSSKVDSRTILDTSGAEQLIGRGDLLLSINSDIIRLQCPFLETDEIETICSYIQSQEGCYNDYQLTELKDEENSFEDFSEKVDKSKVIEKDTMFDQAAEIIVLNQLGSTSLLQRKLQLGYARAGRIMDQLEQAGIVGPADGSKPREVFVSDLSSLDNVLGR